MSNRGHAKAALREWLNRLWGTLRRKRADHELEEELQLHRELAARDMRGGSGSPERAERAAALKVGGMTQAMEALRDQRGVPGPPRCCRLERSILEEPL